MAFWCVMCPASPGILLQLGPLGQIGLNCDFVEVMISYFPDLMQFEKPQDECPFFNPYAVAAVSRKNQLICLYSSDMNE